MIAGRLKRRIPASHQSHTVITDYGRARTGLTPFSKEFGQKGKIFARSVLLAQHVLSANDQPSGALSTSLPVSRGKTLGNLVAALALEDRLAMACDPPAFSLELLI